MRKIIWQGWCKTPNAASKPWFWICVQATSFNNLLIEFIISKSNELKIANKYILKNTHCFYLSIGGAYKTQLGSCYKEHLQTTALRQEEFDRKMRSGSMELGSRWGLGRAEGWCGRKESWKEGGTKRGLERGHKEDGKIVVLPTSATWNLCPGERLLVH